MLETWLLVVAVAYFVSGKHRKDTAIAAYEAGKEPPGVAKARMRSDGGGGHGRGRGGSGGRSGRGGGDGLGALIGTWWRGAMGAATARAQHNAERRRAWNEDQAPNRDEAWQEKQRARLAKRGTKIDRFRRRHKVIDWSGRDEEKAWEENERRDKEARAWDEAHAEKDRREDEAWAWDEAKRYDTEQAWDDAHAEKARRDAEPPRPDPYDYTGSGPDEDLPDVGKPAELDDVAPHGEVITPEHVREYRRRVNEAHRVNGMRPPDWDAVDASWRRTRAERERPADRSEPAERPRPVDLDEVQDAIKGQAGMSDPANPGASGESYTPAASAKPAPTAAEVGTELADQDGQAPAKQPDASPAAAGSRINSPSTASDIPTGDAMDHKQGAAALNTSADRLDNFGDALNALGVDLQATRWGPVVNGPLQEMKGSLGAAGRKYRDTAEQMYHQGEEVAEATDQAPWVPDEAVMN